MRWPRGRHALNRGACRRRGSRNQLFLRQSIGDRFFVRRTAANFYAKTFTLKLELRQSVFRDQANQLAQLVHIDRLLEVLRLVAMPTASTIAIARTTLGAISC